jgi:PIN domain nuclease of toxin-antitoxin system
MGRDEVILLDTHVLIWLSRDDISVGKQTRAVYDRAIKSGDVAISVISYWELRMLVAKGRLAAAHAPAHYRRHIQETAIEELPLTGEIAILASGLKGLHGDPADRFIAASAIVHGATLMTADRTLLSLRNALPRQNAAK